MSKAQPRHWPWSGWRMWLAIVVLIAVAGAAVVFAAMRNDRGPAPKLLNQPTKAREARPFTEKPDPRFDPLPLEREKHGR